jgi:hypothetical protein
MDMLLNLVEQILLMMAGYIEQAGKYILKQMIFFILKAQPKIKPLP